MSVSALMACAMFLAALPTTVSLVIMVMQDDDGLRYHLAYHPLPQLKLQVEYDSGEDGGVGGGITYRHILASAASGSSSTSSSSFNPQDYLFAPVNTRVDATHRRC